MLKKAPTAVIQALELILNTSIISGRFPDAWKYALVTPMYKRGDIYGTTNYHPIALLPTISKVFEKLAHD